MIRNLLIIKSGVLLLDYDFNLKNSLNSDMNLISGFIGAIQSFSSSVAHSSINTMNFENFTFHFFSSDRRFPNLYFILITDLDFPSREIHCKLKKIASIFIDKYEMIISKFNGDVSQFKPFLGNLDELKIEQKHCGSHNKCINCPFRANRFHIDYFENKGNLNSVQLLNDLFLNLLNIVPDLIAALLIDFDGFLIVQQPVKDINEEVLNSILDVIDPIVMKSNKASEEAFGSGIIDTNEFRLFYIKIDGKNPVLFIIIIDSYSTIDEIIPYCYIAAEKVSLILYNREPSVSIPKLVEGGSMKLGTQSDSLNTNNIMYQVFLIGSAGGGKSSLLEMYVKGKYLKEYKPTIGLSIAKKSLQITKNLKITFLLFDMGGLKSFTKVRQYFYRISQAKAIIILFDYTKQNTLEEVNEWLEEARFFIDTNSLNLVLVGNKIDLINNRDEIRTKAKLIADQLDCQFFETSALTGEGIDDIFMYLGFNR